MPYIQRTDSNEIIGVYRALQRGYAEEYVADDDRELLDYHLTKEREKKEREVDDEASHRLLKIESREDQIDALASALLVVIKENKSYNDVQNGVEGATRYEATTEEKSQLSNYNSNYEQSQTIRSSQDTLKSDIATMSEEELDNFDATDDSNWNN